MPDEYGNETDDERAAREAREADERRAAEQPRPAQLAPGYAELNEGDHCPLCNVGVLFKIAEDKDSVTLRCFNCMRQGSHRPSKGYQVHTTAPTQTPTGFTLSAAQHAAKTADDPEQAAASAGAAEAGSGVVTRPVGGESG